MNIYIISDCYKSGAVSAFYLGSLFFFDSKGGFMNSFVVIAVVGMLLFSGSPRLQAQECEQRLNEAERQVRELQRPVARLGLPKLTGILRRDVTHFQAEEICNEMGTRLPTIREFAQIAQNEHEAVGISETGREELATLIKKMIGLDDQNGYYRIEGADSAGIGGVESAGNPDIFYFSKKGYKRPAGDLGNSWFWSSSVRKDKYGWAWAFDGREADVSYSSRLYQIASVRCVAR